MVSVCLNTVNNVKSAVPVVMKTHLKADTAQQLIFAFSGFEKCGWVPVQIQAVSLLSVRLADVRLYREPELAFGSWV